MPFAEDLSIFTADFGVEGTLAGLPVRGIYDAPGGTSLGMVVTEPQFQLPSANVPASVFNVALVIPQGSFTVREAIPDGTGMTLLILSKA